MAIKYGFIKPIIFSIPTPLQELNTKLETDLLTRNNTSAVSTKLLWFFTFMFTYNLITKCHAFRLLESEIRQRFSFDSIVQILIMLRQPFLIGKRSFSDEYEKYISASQWLLRTGLASTQKIVDWTERESGQHIDRDSKAVGCALTGTTDTFVSIIFMKCIPPK